MQACIKILSKLINMRSIDNLCRKNSWSGKICRTVDRKAMCLAYNKAKIGSVTNTLNWRDKDVIVSTFNSLFCGWSPSQLTTVFGD